MKRDRSIATAYPEWGLCGFVGSMRANTTPISNNKQIGMASKTCEITSGGVSNIETVKAAIIK